jgi:hypothetical protein
MAMISTPSRVALRDSLFLATIVLISSTLYIARLGFYSDDWFFLDRMSHAESGTIPDLFRSLYEPQYAMRPAQLLYFASLYALFGMRPLGYHLVNTLVFVVMAVFAYLALRGLNVSRVLAVSIALVFVLLPHYSTSRFWFSTIAHTLSMALYFASLSALLRALKPQDRLRYLLWLAASLVALAASGLSYEVPLPLFALNAGLGWYLAPRLAGSHSGLSATRTRGAIAGVATIASLTVIAAFKWQTTVRLGSAEEHSMLTILRRAWRFNVPPDSYGLNIEQAIRTSFGDYGVGLPGLIWRVLRDGPSISTLVLTIVVAAAVAGYLLALGRSSEAGASERAAVLRQSAALLGGGLGVFWLGYAIFLTNSNLQFTTTGVGNRANIGAAAGVALVLVGAVDGLSGLWSSRTWRVRVFALMVAMLCAASVLLNNVIAGHWIRAYEQERAILADLHLQQPRLPPQSTLILDGVCPYVGPAIVFESTWDLRGALRLMYRDSSIEADVATNKMRIEPLELTTELYGEVDHYPFRNGLLLYDQRRRTVYPLSDPEAARRYFAARLFNPARDCPPGQEGLGAPVW